MWERENMDDSARKTSHVSFLFFFSVSEASHSLSSGWASWWNVAELKYPPEDRMCSLSVFLLAWFSGVLLLECG